jgi:hypothetical protein
VNKWRKYEFVCDPIACDSLLELTVKDGEFKFPNGVAEITCPCGRQMTCTSANLIQEEKEKEEAPMETTQYLQGQITLKDLRINDLENDIDRLSKRYDTTINRLRNIEEGMKEWTIEAVKSRDISETNAEEISDIVGFELKTETEVEVNVTYYITVETEIGDDVDSIINDIDFDAITYDCDKVTHVSSSVDAIDF